MSTDRFDTAAPRIGRRAALGGSALALGAAVLSACGGDKGAKAPTTFESEADELGLYKDAIIVNALEKPTLTWTDHNGQPYNIAEATADRTTLLFFGYTSCPDECPVYLNNITEAIKRLSGTAKVVNVLFVGVDTERDTPEVMKSYLGTKSPDYVGLTATPEEIDSVLASLLLPSVAIPDDRSGNYAVGHPTNCIVFTKDNLAHVMYPYDLRISEWEAELAKLDTIEWPAESTDAS